MFLAFLRTIWTVMRKDIRIWLRQPANIAATIIPPIGFLLVEALGAAARWSQSSRAGAAG